MTSMKMAARCTIDLLPHTSEFDAVAALRNGDKKWYRCWEQRFSNLQEVQYWGEQIYSVMEIPSRLTHNPCSVSHVEINRSQGIFRDSGKIVVRLNRDSIYLPVFKNA